MKKQTNVQNTFNRLESKEKFDLGLISLIGVATGSVIGAEISGLTKYVLLETDKCYKTVNGVYYSSQFAQRDYVRESFGLFAGHFGVDVAIAVASIFSSGLVILLMRGYNIYSSESKKDYKL